MSMRPLIPAFLALASSPALAHPGHGHGDGFSLLHYLSAPEHVAGLVLLAVVGGGIAGWWLRRRRRDDRRD
ncbi:hypothetical protein [Thioalkalivibrio sp. ALJ16]|uniref:hypothetical protein n=1 Tax=Thioalkalivibrio sp. ALJ16 TaxID=1158762 RepID=UPI00036EF515|nr:hypothetical protein [Thioalkalivibrio sp. ALJ16]